MISQITTGPACGWLSPSILPLLPAPGSLMLRRITAVCYLTARVVNSADIRSAVPVSHDRRGGAGGSRTHYLVCRRACIVYPPAIAWVLHPRYPPANLRVTIHAAAPCVYMQSVIPPQAGGPAHTDRPTCPPKRRYQATLLSPRPVRCQP